MKKYSLMIICCMVYSISILGQTTLNTFSFPDDTKTDPQAIGELVINEILTDPGPLDGDANGDGIRDAYDDEFVEIINGELNAIDMSNYSLSDATGLRHTFPPGTILPSGKSIVVFGGGTPTGIPGIVQVASTGLLSLTNSGDEVILKDNFGTLITSYSYILGGDQDQSLAREPDITGPSFKLHTEILSNPVPYSPGRYNTTDIPVSVEFLSSPPKEYELAQNFPNPFNPNTSIKFTLPEAGNVKLKVYNLLGQEIRTLVNEYKEAGAYTINFDASDLNSGMYIYKIEAGSFTQTRKMTLIK